ncbi:MAG: hypothetical protein IJU48_02565 [Synergistaceae bacterium]|nr:hypothetical protein [Synergistaceae bacterium]
MPEELDPTTARLVSELAAQILPALTKSLSAAIPSLDFSVLLEKNNRISQELSLQVERAIQSVVEESKTSHNLMNRSFENMHEEISGLTSILERHLTAKDTNIINEISNLKKFLEKRLETANDANIINEISELKNILDKPLPANSGITEADILDEISSLKRLLTSSSPVDKAIHDEFADLKRTLGAHPSIEKTIQTGIDDSRAGRTIIAQSIASVLEEIRGLKRTLDKLPGNLELIVKSNKPEVIATTNNDNSNNDEILRELSAVSDKLQELTSGIKYFFETYASSRETQTYEVRDTPILTNDAQLDKIINTSLPNLEGLVKAESQSRHHELEEFSREISTLHEQNNLAMINGVKEAVAQELAKHHENITSNQDTNGDKKVLKLLKMSIMFSGAGMFLVIITILMLIMK